MFSTGWNWLSEVASRWEWGTVPQWLLFGTAVCAALVAYHQYRSSKLFQLLQFLEKPEIRDARHKLFSAKETIQKDKWWETCPELAKAAGDICASYDIVWRIAKGSHRRFFRRHWAYSICWTHEVLGGYLEARRDEGDRRAYQGFDNLYCEARRFDPRLPCRRRSRPVRSK